MTPPAVEGRLLRIRGVVQGVGFRWHLATEAARLDLQGWVRNRVDGSVEAMVWGAPAAVAELVFWAGRGAGAARVAHVLVEDCPERPAGFQRLTTR